MDQEESVDKRCNISLAGLTLIPGAYSIRKFHTLQVPDDKVVYIVPSVPMIGENRQLVTDEPVEFEK